MTLTEKKIVAVVGSTGVQAGRIVRSLLHDGTFAVRAVARDVNKAQGLKALGVGVVAADAEDMESLQKAFRGAWGVFGVTVWGLLPIHKGHQAEAQAHEEQNGRNLVDAAEAEGVQHFVWSTLPHIEPYTVYHFASKVTEGDGFVVAFSLPSTSKIPSFDPYEIGSWVLAVLKSEPTGKTYNACKEMLTPPEYAETLSHVSGKTVKVQEGTPQAFESKEHMESRKWALARRSSPSSMKSYYDGLFIQDIKKSHEENPHAKTFEEFARTDPELGELMGY